MHLDLLSRVALTVASSRHEHDTLVQIVNGLVEEAGVALARIWLVTSDTESNCEYLKLRASAGVSAIGRKEHWRNLDGRFSRFDMGARKIGLVGTSGKPVIIEDLALNLDWVADREW